MFSRPPFHSWSGDSFAPMGNQPSALASGGLEFQVHLAAEVGRCGACKEEVSLPPQGSEEAGGCARTEQAGAVSSQFRKRQPSLPCPGGRCYPTILSVPAHSRRVCSSLSFSLSSSCSRISSSTTDRFFFGGSWKCSAVFRRRACRVTSESAHSRTSLRPYKWVL